MKITGAAVVALLASTTTAASWKCNRSGGDGHGKLKELHGDFNRLFGAPRLHIAGGQCYIVKCRGYYFGVCNNAKDSEWEVSGDRNVARNANPKSGSSCGITPSWNTRPYMSYIFSRVKDVKVDDKSVRSC